MMIFHETECSKQILFNGKIAATQFYTSTTIRSDLDLQFLSVSTQWWLQYSVQCLKVDTAVGQSVTNWPSSRGNGPQSSPPVAPVLLNNAHFNVALAETRQTGAGHWTVLWHSGTFLIIDWQHRHLTISRYLHIVHYDWLKTFKLHLLRSTKDFQPIQWIFIIHDCSNFGIVGLYSSAL